MAVWTQVIKGGPFAA